MNNYLKKLTYSYILVQLMFGLQINATSLRDSVEQTINTNPDIIAEHYNKKENRINIKKEESDIIQL